MSEDPLLVVARPTFCITVLLHYTNTRVGRKGDRKPHRAAGYWFLTCLYPAYFMPNVKAKESSSGFSFSGKSKGLLDRTPLLWLLMDEPNLCILFITYGNVTS